MLYGLCTYSATDSGELWFVCTYSKLMLTVDSTDDNYMPKRVTVFGGEAENLKKYSDVTIDE